MYFRKMSPRTTCLVLGRVHVVSELVRGLPERGLKPEVPPVLLGLGTARLGFLRGRLLGSGLGEGLLLLASLPAAENPPHEDLLLAATRVQAQGFADGLKLLALEEPQQLGEVHVPGLEQGAHMVGGDALVTDVQSEVAGEGDEAITAELLESGSALLGRESAGAGGHRARNLPGSPRELTGLQG